MDQKKIGRFIAGLRKEACMTQTELGERLGVSYKAVSKWETGRCLPDPSLYKSLCDILNINMTELFNGERVEVEELAEKADQAIAGVVEQSMVSRTVLLISSLLMVCGTMLVFIPSLLNFDNVTSIVTISAGLLMIFGCMAVKLASWKMINDKTIENTGIGFTGTLTILFIGLKLTGHIDWGWIWVVSPLWIGLAAVICFLVIVFVIWKTREKLHSYKR